LGSVANVGGSVIPGDPETFNISGDYLQSAGALTFQIDGVAPGDFDMLAVGGAAAITGGSIVFDFANGFAPTAGESFDLISAQGGVMVSNTSFVVDGLAAGWDYSISDANGQFLLTALNNGVSAGGGVTGTPEPSTWVMMFAGFAGLGFLGWCRAAKVRAASG
jgi:hypothetical protein